MYLPNVINLINLPIPRIKSKGVRIKKKIQKPKKKIQEIIITMAMIGRSEKRPIISVARKGEKTMLLYGPYQNVVCKEKYAITMSGNLNLYFVKQVKRRLPA